MATRLSLAPHLSCEALFARYRRSSDPIERARLHALWLLSLGQSSRQVVQTLGYRANWLYRTVALYNAHGPQALADGRRCNPGHPPLLRSEQLATLADLLEKPAPDGEPWSGPKVAAWMSEQLGRAVRPQRGWDYLRRAGFSRQRPRPRHRDADPEAQARFPAGVAPASGVGRLRLRLG